MQLFILCSQRGAISCRKLFHGCSYCRNALSLRNDKSDKRFPRILPQDPDTGPICSGSRHERIIADLCTDAAILSAQIKVRNPYSLPFGLRAADVIPVRSCLSDVKDMVPGDESVCTVPELSASEALTACRDFLQAEIIADFYKH